MKRQFKRITICLMVAGLMLSIVPLSSYAAELSLWTRVAEVKESYDWVIAEYEKRNPHVRIYHRIIDWSRSSEVLLPAFVAGIAPDIANLADVSLMKELARQDQIMNLDEWYAKYGNRFPAGADIWLQADDSYVAVPTYQIGLIDIYYNKELTEKYGIRPTDDWTWSEFVGTLEKVKDLGDIPLVMGNKEGADGEHFIQSLLTETIGGSGIMKLLQRTDPDAGPRWTDPKVVQAVQEFEDIHKYMIEGSAAISQHAGFLLFSQGKGVFKHDGTYLTSVLADSPEFRWGWFRFPHMVGEIGETRNGGVASYHTVLSVSSESQYKDIALDFLEFFSRPEIMGHAFYGLRGWMPSTIGALESYDLSEYEQHMLEFYETCDDNAVWMGVYLPAEVTNVILRGATSISTGSLSATEFCKRVEKAHQEYLREKLQK